MNTFHTINDRNHVNASAKSSESARRMFPNETFPGDGELITDIDSAGTPGQTLAGPEQDIPAGNDICAMASSSKPGASLVIEVRPEGSDWAEAGRFPMVAGDALAVRLSTDATRYRLKVVLGESSRVHACSRSRAA